MTNPDLAANFVLVEFGNIWRFFCQNKISKKQQCYLRANFVS